MTNHVTREQMEGFCARTLNLKEAAAVGGHTAWCQPCLQLFRTVFQQRRNHAPASINLSPEFWFVDEHLDYDQLVDLVDERMDEEEREITSLHLRTCVRCRGDVQSFLEYRREIEPEMQISFAPGEERTSNGRSPSWWRWPWAHWRPVYGTAVLAVLAVVMTASFLLWRARTNDRQSPRLSTQTTDGSPTPSVIASASPLAVKSIDDSTQPLPISSPAPPAAGLATSIALLNDNGKRLELGQSGIITGLENLAPELQRAIKEALLAGTINKPATIAALNGVQGPVRGSGDRKPTFKLLSPGGVVLAEARPIFTWEPLAGAISYRVLVADAANQEAAASGPLSPSVTQWTPPTPLQRGEIYTWVVIATTNGGEITAPAATAPEMKFSVMTEEKFKLLARLRRGTKSHLARGVFYAREGMLEEAEREFEQLTKENPRSPIAIKLLRSVQSWR